VLDKYQPTITANERNLRVYLAKLQGDFAKKKNPLGVETVGSDELNELELRKFGKYMRTRKTIWNILTILHKEAHITKFIQARACANLFERLKGFGNRFPALRGLFNSILNGAIHSIPQFADTCEWSDMNIP
jgi:hypothetical protein